MRCPTIMARPRSRRGAPFLRAPAGRHMRIEILSSPVEPCLMLASPLDPATGALIVGSNVRLAGRPQERAAPTASRPCPDRMHRKRDDRGSQDISQLGALCAPLTNHGVPRDTKVTHLFMDKPLALGSLKAACFEISQLFVHTHFFSRKTSSYVGYPTETLCEVRS